jgi:hypothetical protein
LASAAAADRDHRRGVGNHAHSKHMMEKHSPNGPTAADQGAWIDPVCGGIGIAFRTPRGHKEGLVNAVVAVRIEDTRHCDIGTIAEHRRGGDHAMRPLGMRQMQDAFGVHIECEGHRRAIDGSRAIDTREPRHVDGGRCASIAIPRGRYRRSSEIRYDIRIAVGPRCTHSKFLRRYGAAAALSSAAYTASACLNRSSTLRFSCSLFQSG